MSDGFIQVPPDSTGKLVDTSEVLVGANTVERQRVNISDPTTVNNHAAVETDQRLQVGVGLVNDTVETFIVGQRVPLSISSDGRLRVQMASESYNFVPWASPYDHVAELTGMFPDEQEVWSPW